MIDFIQTQLPQYLYALFCILSVLCAFGVVALKNPVASAFSLILVLLNVAGIFALQEAYFIAAVQVLVYAGAIMVLFIFVIMLLSIEFVDQDMPENKALWLIPIGLGALFFAVISFVLTKGSPALTKGPFSISAIEESGGNIRVVSEVMFSDYVLPFQIVGMLLSITVVGAVVLAKRKVD
jgi:NADH-quinone oxidoreductase subunit J